MRIQTPPADMFVVPLILLLIGALVAPAVLHQREQAREKQRQSQLQQIGLSLHGYHDTFRSFPASPKSQATPKPKPRDKPDPAVPKRQPAELVSPL